MKFSTEELGLILEAINMWELDHSPDEKAEKYNADLVKAFNDIKDKIYKERIKRKKD